MARKYDLQTGENDEALPDCRWSAWFGDYDGGDPPTKAGFGPSEVDAIIDLVSMHDLPDTEGERT